MKIPVIIAHFDTAPAYLGYSLSSAAGLNSQVILIGDKANQHVWKNHWDASSIEPEKYQNFMRNYVQMSDYSKKYEISFWKRMFLLEEWMKVHGSDKAFLLDSDIITFANYTADVYPLLPQDCIAGLTTPEKQDNFFWAASTHFSYWTLEGIESFTNFCIDTYTNRNNLRSLLEAKHKWHLENCAPGGVSEMTLLYLWSKDNSRIYNFAKTLEGMASDHSISTPTNYHENEYKLRFGVKQFVFKNGIPYGYNNVLNKKIKFVCLHCQGDAKLAMKLLVSKRWRRFYFAGRLIGQTRAFLGARKAALKQMKI
ncbi:MAG: hypothetical protein KME42_23770 [Tildeniella nuda ZEHNDER 1965/U140]|jgi:hypothetical protein|nr:hypothetical protein [Tildeniella nuda ZEHNDER 1965/U140]